MRGKAEWRAADTERKLEMLRENDEIISEKADQLASTVQQLCSDRDTIRRLVEQNELLLKQVAEAVQRLERR
jgi:hypothetical protein